MVVIARSSAIYITNACVSFSFLLYLLVTFFLAFYYFIGRPNYTGVNCQFEIKPCDTYLCTNGGSCTVGDDGEPHCACPNGFTGVYCEHCNS
jgi:hypothetical protein